MVINLAGMGGLVEFEAFVVELPAAPIKHLGVDIDADVPSPKSRAVVIVVAEMMSKLTAAAADVDDRGLEIDPRLVQRKVPEVPCANEIPGLVGKDFVSHPDADPQMVWGKPAEFREKYIGDGVGTIKQEFENWVVRDFR